MHRVSLSLVPYKCFLHFFFPLSNGLEKNGDVCLPCSPAFLILWMLCIKNAAKVKTEILFSSRSKSVTRYLLLLCPSLHWAIVPPLWYLGVSSTAMTMLFGCCPEQWFQGPYEDSVCLDLFVLSPSILKCSSLHANNIEIENTWLVLPIIPIYEAWLPYKRHLYKHTAGANV